MAEATDGPASPVGRRPRRVLVAAALAVTVLALGLLAHGVRAQYRVNHNATDGDQSEYMGYAFYLATQPDAYVPDRGAGPLYPWMVASALRLDRRPTTTISQDVHRGGKQFNIGVAVACLALGAFHLRRRIGWGAAALGAGSLAFGLLVFKAPWVQSEIISYALVSAAVFSMYDTLVRPAALRGARSGLLLGFAMLAKPTALFAAALFVGTCVVGGLWALGRRRSEASTRRGARLLAAGAAALLLFVAMMAPYAATTQRFYGSPLYNVNTTYYIWYDSWQDVATGSATAGDRRGVPDLPSSEVPSFSRYARTHDLGDAVGRLATGYRQQAGNLWAFGWGWPLVVLWASALAVAVVDRERSIPRIRRLALPLGFLVVLAAGYFTSWAWWAAINSQPRYVMAAFFPTLFAALAVVHRGLEGRSVLIAGRRARAVTAWSVAYGAFLVPFALHTALSMAGRVEGGV